MEDSEKKNFLANSTSNPLASTQKKTNKTKLEEVVFIYLGSTQSKDADEHQHPQNQICSESSELNKI